MLIQKDTYIYKKGIDWSSLHMGINIPVSLQVHFFDLIQHYLKKGESKPIKLVIENETFEVKLINQPFDETKYPTHKELLQIRYSSGSAISKKLKGIFKTSYEYLKIEKSKLKNRRIPIKVPEEIREYLVLYTTDFEDTFLTDCITSEDMKHADNYIKSFTEEEFELNINYNRVDISARIEEKPQMVKVRRLDKSICDNLRLLYKYKCQICGYNFAEKYNGNIVEAHHIQSFTITMNNNSDNILIICPNHHRVIHKVNPFFDRKNLIFIYQNGLKENLALNYHL
ncbi:MAG TPA: HNH endonuclease [Desulfobacteraceae bacterium]|nr:HNH endonuclease [Desulfobacteraceae bacterium]